MLAMHRIGLEPLAEALTTLSANLLGQIDRMHYTHFINLRPEVDRPPTADCDL